MNYWSSKKGVQQNYFGRSGPLHSHRPQTFLNNAQLASQKAFQLPPALPLHGPRHCQSHRLTCVTSIERQKVNRSQPTNPLIFILIQPDQVLARNIFFLYLLEGPVGAVSNSNLRRLRADQLRRTLPLVQSISTEELPHSRTLISNTHVANSFAAGQFFFRQPS